MTQGNGSICLIYDAGGLLVKAEAPLATSALPRPVKYYFKRNYMEAVVKKVYKIIELDGTVTFSAELNGMNLIFDSEGSFIKSAKL